MSGYVEEYYDMLHHRVRTARKEHRCSACNRKIRPGDRYAYVFIVFEGDTETYKRCGACEVTWQHLMEVCMRRTGGEMYPREDLSCGLEYAKEWGGDPPEEIARLPMVSDDEAGKLLEPDAAQHRGSRD